VAFGLFSETAGVFSLNMLLGEVVDLGLGDGLGFNSGFGADVDVVCLTCACVLDDTGLGGVLAGGALVGGVLVSNCDIMAATEDRLETKLPTLALEGREVVLTVPVVVVVGEDNVRRCANGEFTGRGIPVDGEPTCNPFRSLPDMSEVSLETGAVEKSLSATLRQIFP
jgi:hypothetical protein